MSTAVKKPTATRTTVTKKKVPVVESPAAPAPEPAPVQPVQPVVAEAPVADNPVNDAPVAETGDSDCHSGIAVARARRHLSNYNVNKQVDVLVEKYKAVEASVYAAQMLLEKGKTTDSVVVEANGKKTVTKVERAATPQEKAAATALVANTAEQLKEAQVNHPAVSRIRTRISGGAPVMLKVLCNEIANELLAAAMDDAIAQKEKMVKISNLHNADLPSLASYPLIHCLPSFVKDAREHKAALAEKEVAAAVKAAVKAALTGAERDFKKKYGIKGPAPAKAQPAAAKDAQPATPAAEEPAAEAPDAHDEAEGKNTFQFYVANICSTLRSEEKYKSMRVAKPLKNYVADLISEFITRLSTALVLTVQITKNKTIRVKDITHVVKLWLVDGHAPNEVIEFSKDAEGTTVATRVITYPTSKFDSFNAKIQQGFTESLAKTPVTEGDEDEA